MRYYVQHDGNQFGPFVEDEIRELMVNGSLSPHDLGAAEDTGIYQELAHLFPPLTADRGLTTTFATPAAPPTPSATPPSAVSPAASGEAPVVPSNTPSTIPAPQEQPSSVASPPATPFYGAFPDPSDSVPAVPSEVSPSSQPTAPPAAPVYEAYPGTPETATPKAPDYGYFGPLTGGGTGSPGEVNPPAPPISEETAFAYKPKTVGALISDAFEVFQEKALSWAIIAILPIIISIIFVMQLMSVMVDFSTLQQPALTEEQQQILDLQRSIGRSPDATPEPTPTPAPATPSVIKNPGKFLPSILTGILAFYISIIAIIMAICGAWDYSEGIDFTLGDLFIMAQYKLPRFLIIPFLLFLVSFLLYLPLSFLPQAIKPMAMLLANILYILLFFRLFPLPFALILDYMNLPDSFRYCFIITRKQLGRILGMVVIIAVIQLLISFSASFSIVAMIVGLLFNVYVLVLSTLFYKDLVERSRLEGVTV